MTITQNWFLLFDGSSEDGRGPGSYKSRTTSADTALTFYRKNIKGNSYSTGKVIMVTDTHQHLMNEDAIKEVIKKDNRAAGIEKRRATLAKKQADVRPAGYGTFA